MVYRGENMKNTFSVYKKNLLSEFEWLREQYPLENFRIHPLSVFDYQYYNEHHIYEKEEEYHEKEVDAFMVNTVINNVVEAKIIMIISEKHEPDDVDEMNMNSFDIEPEHLFYWILYHEYGHLVQLHKTYVKNGLEAMEKERDESDEEVDKLENKLELGFITDDEFDKAYRNLWFEKVADDFANHIYQIRKNELPK